MDNTTSTGYVYVMTHSFFSDVIRISHTKDDPEQDAKFLSSQSPGEYKVVFSIECADPSKINNQIKKYLTPQKYIDEFYQTSIKVASKLLERETLKIPTSNTF